MPVYEYHCKKCDGIFEEWQKISEPPVKICTLCNSRRVEKLISQSTFHLKGSGWYLTDYGRKSSPPKDEKSETKSEAKSETKSEKNTDSKKKDQASTKAKKDK